ncbi:MAG: Ig-like domain-containing protein [Clostridia bacterium]|nr:Ig-like domain-containing protein [Clostridia bacterium]
MTKKLLSLVLSAVLVIGAFPIMNVFAADASPFFAVDFESYTAGTAYNSTFSSATYLPDEANSRFSFGKYICGEIVSMSSYSNSATKALKLKVDSTKASSWDASGGDYRPLMYRKPGAQRYIFDGISPAKFVMNFNIYVPANDGDKSRTFKQICWKPFVMSTSGDKVSFGIGKGFDNGQYKMYYTGDKGAWYKLTYIFDATSGSNAVASLWVNDTLAGYNVADLSLGTTPNEYMYIQSFSNTAAADIAEEYIIVDDFNYHTPVATTAQSEFDAQGDVQLNASIPVSFSNFILNTTTANGATVSTSNVGIVAKNGGSSVEVESVTVGQDGKSIYIQPKDSLTKLTTYTVTVTGIKDMYDEVVADYSFDFTTADAASVSFDVVPTFTKGNLFDVDGSSEAIQTLQNGYINTSFTVRNNNANSSQKVLAFVVLKEGDTIKQFMFEEGLLAPNGSLTFNGGFLVGNPEGCSIETFVWDALYSGTPLTPKYTLTTSGITPAQ